MSADFTFCPIRLFSRFFLHPLLHLLPDQPLVNPVQLNQLRVPAPLHHPPVLHHQDFVGISHCRQSMGDHQDGPTLHDPLKGFRDHLELYNVEEKVFKPPSRSQHQGRRWLRPTRGSLDCELLLELWQVFVFDHQTAGI